MLNERKIEFAYEGKRVWDLRRWMLYNDDFGTLQSFKCNTYQWYAQNRHHHLR